MDEGLLNDLLECSVCLERLDTSSRVLPCQHTFCMQCLREIVYCQKELRCPECRVLVETPVDELPPNVLLMRILEGMRNSSSQQHSSRMHQPPQVIPRRPIIGPATFMEPVSSYGFTYSDGDGKHTNVIPKSTPHAKALYDYFSKEPGDLNFKQDEVIILRRQIDPFWYHGETNGNQGAFPITFAKIVVPLPPPIPQCTALYDFHMAAHEEEGCLAFNKGAVINVIRRVDENWAEGRLHDKIGIFPIAFVEMNGPALSVINAGTIGNTSSSANKIISRSTPMDSLSTNKAQSYNFIQKHAVRTAIMPNQVAVAHRQQQMSISSPMPHMGVAMQRQQHNMSQSHPVYLHQQQFNRPVDGCKNSTPFGDLFDFQDNRGQTSSNVTIDNTKVRATGGANINAGFNHSGNQNSDSSSTTTTPSFGGSSVTTTPNTSSSNTSSESNTPSSPASPATTANHSKSVSVQQKPVPDLISGQNNYTNIPQAAARNITTTEVQEDAGGSYSNVVCENVSDGSLSSSTLNASTVSGDSSYRNVLQPSSNSPQNVNGNISNVTPPRSNMSSPQTLNSSTGYITSQLDVVHLGVNKSISPNQLTQVQQYSNAKHKMDSHSAGSSSQVPFTTYYNFNEKHRADNLGIMSPRHGGKDNVLMSTPRSSHSHNRDKEKRNSLTPGGQALNVPTSMNRRSAEILSSGSLLDQEFNPESSSSKHGEKEKHQLNSEKGKDGKDKSKRNVTDRQQPIPYVALYAYKPQKADELELKKGGIYMVLEQCQDGWYKGCSSRTHKCGVFPGNYVIPAVKAHQLTSKKGSSSQHHDDLNLALEYPKSSKETHSHSSGKHKNSNDLLVQIQPPDLPPRAQSPGASNQGFPWSSSPKCSSSSSSKPSDKSKDKSKADKNTSSGVSLMKRLTGMKKSRSPPPTNSGFSMDNPVFEDCPPEKHHDGTSTTNQQPIHIRSGSCPSQLLQGAQINTHHQQHQTATDKVVFENAIFGNQIPIGGSISSAVAHRLFPSHHAVVKGSGAQTLGPCHGPSQRRQARPTVLNAMTGFHDGSGKQQGQTLGRSSGEVPWLPVSTRHHHHRKSHSLDAGQQLKSSKESSNQPINKRFRCIVAYPPNSEYELELQVDDVILVHKQWGEGWYKGTLERTGHTGLVPASFVEAC